MTVRPVRPRPRPWSSGLVGLLVAASVLAGAPAPAAAAPPYSLEERAVAIASPALVYVEMVYTGYVRDKTTNVALRTRPVTVSRRCSGFVVNPDGHVVTNGVCLQPGDEAVRQSALYSLGRMLIDEEQLDPKGLDAFVAKNRTTTVYTGLEPADRPESRVYGQFTVATGDLTASPAVPGEVVQTLDADQGNVALVKLQRGSLPAVELNPATELQQGTDLVAIGFDRSDSGSRGEAYTPRWKAVKLSGVGTRGLVPVFRVNGDVGSTSRGGMLIDTSGRVVGMIDSDQARSDRDSRAAIQSATIANLLKDKGIANTLSDTDRRYRSGLDAYFAGRYSAAISAFEAVATASPDNQVAQKYRQDAADRRDIEGDAARMPTWLAVLIGALGGLALAGLVAAIALTLRRRSQRRRQVAGFAPYSYPPVSAAPMSGTPMSGTPMSGGPSSGTPGYPMPAYPMPAYPTPAYAAPAYTTPVSGTPVSGTPMSGTPMSGAAGGAAPGVPGTSDAGPATESPQGWAGRPALPSQEPPLDEHGLPTYPGGAGSLSNWPPGAAGPEENRPGGGDG